MAYDKCWTPRRVGLNEWDDLFGQKLVKLKNGTLGRLPITQHNFSDGDRAELGSETKGTFKCVIESTFCNSTGGLRWRAIAQASMQSY